MLLDLPIDHFRLLGVSPSAAPEAILRRLEARCDSPPDQGFTHEVLLQRADLLRRSADLLTDPADRACLLYTSPSPRDKRQSRMPSSA